MKKFYSKSILTELRNGNLRAIEVLLIGYLILPILIYPFYGSIESTLWNGLFWLNILSTFLWASVIINIPIKPIKLYLFLLPIFLLVAADLFLITQFKARLSASYILIAASDAGDSLEFFKTYSGAILLSLIILSSVLFFSLFGLRAVSRDKPGKIFFASIFLLVSLFVAMTARGLNRGDSIETVLMDIASKDMSSPVGGIFQSVSAGKLISMNSEAIERRKLSSLLISQTKSIPSQAIVLIVGESSRPQSWSLFGYPRKTTPKLDRRIDIIPLRDLLTTAPHTSVAVPSMLSLGTIKSWDSIAASKSIVSAFKQSGFETYWASTQEADGWGGLVPIIAQEANHRRYFDRSHDQVLVDYLATVLKESKSAEKIFFVLHTKGSHFEYTRRYPKEFEIFKREKPTKKDAIIDSYDNTIAYTDNIVSEVISILNESNRPAAVVYVSDHGENLMDDDRQLFGHAMGTEYDLRTAGLIWLSNSMTEQNPQKMEQVKINANKPISLMNIGRSLLSLANLKTLDGNDEMDIFSENFTPQSRYFRVRGNLLEYKQQGK